MPLALIELHTSEAATQRGLAQAEQFLHTGGIALAAIYREVLADAEGKPHDATLVELWDRAQAMAIETALQGEPPLSVPCLIFTA